MATETLAVTLLMRATQYKTEARQAATATGQIGTQAQMTGTATGKLDKQMGGLATTAKFAVAGIAAGAVAKFGKDSVQAFLGFDDAMNQSIAIMGDVSDSLRGDMETAAREVGKTMRISAEEAAESFFFLASAGLDAEQSIAAMPQVAAFAQAGMFDMARATDLATDAQSALGLTVDDAGRNLVNLTRVTDVFVKANTLANTTVEQIAEAMTTRAGPALRALNKDIEEGAAVLAALADQGIKGAEAGTQLGIVIRDLQTKAIDNADAFREAGIAVFDSNEKMRNLGEIIADVEGRMDGMSDAAKRAELSQLGFSDRSIAVLTTLLGTSDAIREYERELRKASGTTQEIADKQMASFQGQLELLQGRVKDLQISIGEGLVPILIGAADVAVNVAQSIGSILGPLGDLIKLLDKVDVGSDSAGESLSLLDGITGTLGETIANVAFFGLPNLIEGLENFFGGAEESTDATEELAGGFSTLGGEMSQIPPLARDTAGGLTDAEKAARDFYRTSGDLSGELRNQGGRWDNVITSMENYETMIRRLTDPVFRAIDDQSRLRGATERYLEVIDDPKSTVEEHEKAILDLVKAQLAAEESAAALPEDLDAVSTHLEILGRRAQITEEDLKRLREMVMSFDGLTANSTVRVNVVGGQKITGGNINTDIGIRHSGGPVTAGETYIWRPGDEILIPSQDGMVIPKDQISSTGAAGAGGVVNNFHFHGDTYGDDGFYQRVREANVQNGRLGLN